MSCRHGSQIIAITFRCLRHLNLQVWRHPAWDQHHVNNRKCICGLHLSAAPSPNPASHLELPLCHHRHLPLLSSILKFSCPHSLEGPSPASLLSICHPGLRPPMLPPFFAHAALKQKPRFLTLSLQDACGPRIASHCPPLTWLESDLSFLTLHDSYLPLRSQSPAGPGMWPVPAPSQPSLRHHLCPFVGGCHGKEHSTGTCFLMVLTVSCCL